MEAKRNKEGWSRDELAKRFNLDNDGNPIKEDTKEKEAPKKATPKQEAPKEEAPKEEAKKCNGMDYYPSKDSCVDGMIIVGKPEENSKFGKKKKRKKKTVRKSKVGKKVKKRRNKKTVRKSKVKKISSALKKRCKKHGIRLTLKRRKEYRRVKSF